jgi:hypothetical protein
LIEWPALCGADSGAAVSEPRADASARSHAARAASTPYTCEASMNALTLFTC